MYRKICAFFCFVLLLGLKNNCLRATTMNDELVKLFATVPGNVTKIIDSKDEKAGHKILEKLAYLLYGLRMVKPLLMTRYAVDYKETRPLAEAILKHGKPEIDKLIVKYEIVAKNFPSWAKEKHLYFVEVVENLKNFLSGIAAVIKQKEDGTYTYPPEPLKVFVDRLTQKEYLNTIVK